MRNFGSIARETFSPDDLLPTGTPPVRTAAPEDEKKRRIVCEFCECRLTIRGDAIEVSDKAKGLRKQGEVIDTLRESIASLTEQITTITAARDAALAQVATLQTDNPRSRSPFSR